METCLSYDLAALSTCLAWDQGRGAQDTPDSGVLTAPVLSGENRAWCRSEVCQEAVLILLPSGKCQVQYAGADILSQQTTSWRNYSCHGGTQPLESDCLGSNPCSAFLSCITEATLLSLSVPWFPPL